MNEEGQKLHTGQHQGNMSFTAVPDVTQLRKYGSLRMKYLKEYRKSLYAELTIEGRLMEHLMETDQRALEMMNYLEEKYKKNNPAPKTEDFMEIVQYNNQVRDYAEEIVMRDVVYS